MMRRALALPVAIALIALQARESPAQELTRMVGSLQSGRATMTISATNKYAVRMFLSDGIRTVLLSMRPQMLEPWLSEVDSISNLAASPKGRDIISFDGAVATVDMLGHQEDGVLIYTRQATALDPHQHNFLLRDAKRAESRISLTTAQLKEFFRLTRRAMKLADSLTTDGQ
jgi:hypothetical protein